ncbi:hypothetical protein COE58_04355 [Bacillus cereus]|uniref:hypothetical protein n=1 Tax=Bacillus cereus group TaxID=86661 RepID=UPI00030F0804|nr:hypothetical protein [Bacillus cereus]PFW59811.1 hypothetical protein COL13_01130 [Bacillus cereus]PGZ63821.1 hypothetical protein COE58_04355 [Bacillus cereus]HDR4559793.1 hypothetical protein [Bacillus luti]
MNQNLLRKGFTVLLAGGMLFSTVACGAKDSIQKELNLSDGMKKEAESKDHADYEKYPKEFRAALKDFPASIKQEEKVLDVTKVDVVQTENKVDVVKVTITQNSPGFNELKEKGNDGMLKEEIGKTDSKLQELYHQFVPKKGNRGDSVSPEFLLEDGTSIGSVNTNGTTLLSSDLRKNIEGK